LKRLKPLVYLFIFARLLSSLPFGSQGHGFFDRAFLGTVANYLANQFVFRCYVYGYRFVH
jgi:hypothetical protein